MTGGKKVIIYHKYGEIISCEGLFHSYEDAEEYGENNCQGSEFTVLLLEEVTV